MRGETLIFVCFYGWVVCPLKTGLYKVNGRSARVTSGHTRPPGRLSTRKNTQKSKFLLSQSFKLKKIMFFVIPEMPSKTFVMLYKKLPDHFKRTDSLSWWAYGYNCYYIQQYIYEINNQYFLQDFLYCPLFLSYYNLLCEVSTNLPTDGYAFGWT